MGADDTWGRRLLYAAAIVLAVLVVFFVGRRLIFGADRFTIEHTRPVTSHVDGLRYRVHEAHAGRNGPDKAADTLATINGRLIDVMRYLRDKYLRGPDGAAYPARRAAAARLLARYNPDNLAENSPRDPSGDTAYSQNKGAVVALCIRERGAADPTAPPIHDLRTLMFVALHEMSHIAIDAVDHPKEFWQTFRFLLESAEEAGIYHSPDFAQEPKVYCGVKVDYNPRFDSGTSSIV